MDRQQFHEILRRYISGTSSDEEKNLIDQWYELLDDDSVPDITEEEMQSIKSTIFQKVKADVTDKGTTPNLSHLKIRWYWWAAAIVGTSFLVITYWKPQKSSRRFTEPYYAITASDYIEKRNGTNEPLTVVLEDSSIVTLSAGSGIKYPMHFKADKREVYMQGEAFFDIKKNPKKPFYVYNNSIITHVLGTSFRVSANRLSNTVSVDVRSGRVEVIENKQSRKGIILTPNQRVIYHESSGQFEASLTDKPLPLLSEVKDGSSPSRFIFEEAPLLSVLKEIEKYYGIDIVVEDETILDNPFTGDISGSDLVLKLDLVCKSLSVCYEVKGLNILIRNHNCN
jgi:transmembrane sensor